LPILIAARRTPVGASSETAFSGMAAVRDCETDAPHPERSAPRKHVKIPVVA
jgi:hypothetical protein